MASIPSVDLHVHSVYSDGRLTPDELAERAARNNVVALAIADHDTLRGADDKREACRRRGVECVSGVELSCEFEGREAHIVSLFADPDSPHTHRIADLSLSRRRRMLLMLDKLAGMGIALDLSDLTVSEDGVYGRPHLARALVDRGIVKSVNEAFARYLYDGGPVHIEKERMSAAAGVELAKKLGGVAILAHPGLSGFVGDLDGLVALGLDGVEVYHPKHGGETIARLLGYCRERGLVVSGGSDFHGPGDGPDIGAARVPRELLEPIRALAASRKG